MKHASPTLLCVMALLGAAADGSADDNAVLERAIKAAPSGGILPVPDGTYTLRAVTIAAPVSVICAAGARLRGAIHIRNTSHVTVRGCQFDSPDAGIAVSNSKDVRIEQNHFSGIGGVAVSLSNVESVSIEGNTFDRVFFSAIRLNRPRAGECNKLVSIRNNRMTGVNLSRRGGHAGIFSDGIATGQNTRLTVEGNHVESLGVGIGVNADDSLIRHNRVIGNGAQGECIAYTGSHTAISGNVVNHCGGAGILLWSSNQNNGAIEVRRNTSWDNAQGIAIVWGWQNSRFNGLTIAENTCFDSGSGRQKYGIQSYYGQLDDGTRITAGTWSRVVIEGNHLGRNRYPLMLVNRGGAVVRRNSLTP